MVLEKKTQAENNLYISSSNYEVMKILRIEKGT